MKYGQQQNKITFIPPVTREAFGWLRIDGESCLIKSWHTWDDYGYDIEIVEVAHKNGKTEELFSDDEGETWRHDIN